MEQENNNNTEKTLQNASDTELKAAAYDLVTQGQIIQSQLNAIQTELNNRYKTRNQSVPVPQV